MSITITLTDSQLDVLQSMISYVSVNEYSAFIEDTEEELDIPFNADDNERIEQALNDDDFSHPYLYSVIIRRLLNEQLK
jgi:hypothetical protein